MSEHVQVMFRGRPIHVRYGPRLARWLRAQGLSLPEAFIDPDLIDERAIPEDIFSRAKILPGADPYAAVFVMAFSSEFTAEWDAVAGTPLSEIVPHHEDRN
jgi:hypothetical protein